MKKSLTNYKLVLFAFLIAILVLRGLLFNNLFIGHSIDWNVSSTSLLIEKYLKMFFYSWAEPDLGKIHPLFFNLIPLLFPFYSFSFFGFSNILISRLMLFTVVFLSTIFFYLFLKHFLLHYKSEIGLKKNKEISEIIIFVSALVYALSPFLFQEIIFGSNVQFLTFALMPLCFFFYLHYLRQDKFLYLALTVVVAVFISASTQNLVFTNLFLLFFSLIDKKIKNYFLYLGVYLIIGSFWILPFIIQFTSFLSLVLNGSAFGDISYLKIPTPNIFKSILGYEYFGNRNNYLATMPDWFFNIWLLNKIIFFISPLFIGLLFIKKRIKSSLVYFLIVIFILDIFFIKGANFPLGGVNVFLYQHIPLFNLFRSQQHYQVIYTFLTALFFALSWIWIAGLRKDKTFKKAILLIVSLTFIIYSLPWLVTGDIGTQSLKDKKKDHLGLYQLSPGYKRLHDIMDEDKTDFRLFNIPLSHSPLYLETEYQDRNQGGNTDNGLLRPTLTTSVASRNLSELADFFDKNISQQLHGEVLSYLLGLLNFKFVALKGDILPHFNEYALDYNYGKVRNFIRGLNFLKFLFEEDYVSLYELSREYFLPHFYIPQNLIYSDGNVENLADIVTFDNYETKSGIFLKDVEGLTDSEINELKKRVDEFFIKADLENRIREEELGAFPEAENLSLPYVRRKPGSLVYPLVLKGEEFSKWRDRDDLEKSFENYLFYGSKRINEMVTFNIDQEADYVLKNYKSQMEGAIGVLEKIKQSGNKDFIPSWIELKGTLWAHQKKISEFGFREDIRDNIKSIFKELEERVDGLNEHDFSRLVYKFDIPQEGEYELYLKEETGEWSKVAVKNFKEGEQELIVPLGNLGENLIDDNLKIRNYLPNSIYQISFDYRAPDGGSLFISEGKSKKVAQTKLLPTGKEQRHFEMFFKSSPGATRGSLHLLVSSVENLKVRLVYQPEIVLRYEIRDRRYETPKITFIKINPTKYKVRVEGAKEPYTLVFSESFHKDWKAYISDQWSVTGDQQYGDIVASYFDGEVKEGTHQNIFLDRSTFETWGKKPIAQDRHYLVNGYANSWYITPEDAGGRENYEIIIEFSPQRLFYLGLGVSGLTLLFCSGFLCYSLINGARKRREFRGLGFEKIDLPLKD